MKMAGKPDVREKTRSLRSNPTAPGRNSRRTKGRVATLRRTPGSAEMQPAQPWSSIIASDATAGWSERICANSP